MAMLAITRWMTRGMHWLGRGALDLAVAYLKNYAVDKADALYTATEPFCNAVTKKNVWDEVWGSFGFMIIWYHMLIGCHQDPH